MAILISPLKVTKRDSLSNLEAVDRSAGSHSATELSSSRSDHTARDKAGGQEGEDQELVYHLLAGDRIAAGRFVSRFERLIHHQLHDLNVPAQDHDDMYQEVFLHLWEDDYRRLRLWQGRGKGKFSSFLRVVVRRLIWDRQRARKFSPPTDPIPPEWATPPVNPQDLLLSKEQQAAIHQTLERLSERDRELLQRRHLLGESYREIGEAMKLTTNNVGVSLRHAERRFKEKFHALYPGLLEIV